MAIAPQRSEIGIRRHFTTEGVHPYDEVRWERRDARITNFRDGTVAFEQLGVEVPESWSVNATNILAQKYFRGTLGTEEREWSLRQVADRVADTLTAWGHQGRLLRRRRGGPALQPRAQVPHHPPEGRLQLAGVVQHRRPRRPAAGQRLPALPRSGQHSRWASFRSAVSSRRRRSGTKVFDAHGVTRIVAVKHNGPKAGPAHPHQGRASAGCHRRPPGVDGSDGTRSVRPRWPSSAPTTSSAGTGTSPSVSTELIRRDIAEAALAGWLQSDGFVGQYEGTNRSLTIEAMTVTEAERRMGPGRS